jgi:predicted MFS family arabinose efflux permease
MSRPARALSYVDVLRLPSIAPAFAATSVARLSYAALPLALLVTVQGAASSYAVAGAAVGGYALAAVGMPLKSRVIDRVGRRFVLPALSCVTGGALVGVVVAARSGVGVSSVFVVLSVLAGLGAPPVGPSMRALWAEVAPDPSDRQRAYSLDAVSEEIVFAAGPLVVGAVLTVSAGWVALLVTAALNVVGALGLAAAPGAGRRGGGHASERRRSLLGPLRSAPFLLLLALLVGIGFGVGPLEVAVVARAQQQASTATAGWLLAALSVGSAVGGLAWGKAIQRRRPGRHLAVLAAVMAAWMAAAAVTSNLVALGAVLFLLGTAVAPALVVAFLAADGLVADAARTEATTWVSTANNAGIAAGAAVAGVLVEQFGATIGLAAGAAALAATSALAVGAQGQLGRDPQHRAGDPAG